MAYYSQRHQERVQARQRRLKLRTIEFEVIVFVGLLALYVITGSLAIKW